MKVEKVEERDEKHNMNIIIASSDLYSKLAITTLKSLFINNEHIKNITIYYIGDKLSEISRRNLIDLVNEYNRNIVFLNMPKSFEQLIGSYRNGQTVFCYCYLQDLLPEIVDKVLLLEGDQIITGDISELYETNIDDYYIAAADDLQSSLYKRKIGMKSESPYVNCGVILYNLKKWRKDNITEKITKVLSSGKHMFFYDVQDVINYTVEGGVLVLPPKYNCTTSVFLFDYEDMIRYRRPSTKCSREEYEYGKKSPLIIHFTKNQIIQPRPWIKGCYHPFNDFYLNIKNQTAMKDEPLWEYNPGKLNNLANYLYMKVSKRFTATLLGIVHAYLYPMFLYKILFKTK